MRGASVLVIQSEQRQAHTPRRKPFMRRRGLAEIIFQTTFPVSGILDGVPASIEPEFTGGWIYANGRNYGYGWISEKWNGPVRIWIGVRWKITTTFVPVLEDFRKVF